jgi:hypothetical protein
MSLDVKYLFTFLEFWSLPTSIQVKSSKIASAVAQDNSIRVDHRDNFDDILLQESIDDVRSVLFLWILNEKVIDFIENTLNYMRTGSFYWMCPSHDENYLLLLD